MPNHFHLLTPTAEIALGKAMRFIRCDFSGRAKMESYLASGIWEGSFLNHSIRDAEGKDHHAYIQENAVRAGLTKDRGTKSTPVDKISTTPLKDTGGSFSSHCFRV